MENDKLTIDVEANGLEQINETLKETVDNAQDLQEALDLPNVTIKWSKNGIGIELNPDYFRDGLAYLKSADVEQDAPTLFDFVN